jgi:hypothetical protein
MIWKKCSCCGELAVSGYVWDNIDFFCSKECLVKALDDDETCADILIEEGERVQWVESSE